MDGLKSPGNPQVELDNPKVWKNGVPGALDGLVVMAGILVKLAHQISKQSEF